MADVLTVGILVAILAVILIGLIFAKQSGADKDGSKSGGRRRAAVPTRDEDGQLVGEGAPVMGPRGRRGATRMRRTPAATAQQHQEDAFDDDHEADAAEDEEGAGRSSVQAPSGKVGKKKLEKLQAKQDKKLEREMMEREREERKKQREKEDEESRARAEREKREEEAEEEAERKKKEERERQEHEEYLKLKASFQLEEEGFDENEEEDTEGQLQQFIQYIEDTKVVLLEDLAAHFKMKAQDCVDRVTQLSEEGRLTGVLDDRGKFIFISQQELESVAKFIKQRGRVSIADLAENSNKLISLKS